MFTVWSFFDNPFGVHVGIPTAGTVFVATVLVSRINRRRHPLDPEVRKAMYPDE